MTVVRSIGNNHSHLGTWCWSQSGRTGKVSAQYLLAARMLSEDSMFLLSIPDYGNF